MLRAVAASALTLLACPALAGALPSAACSLDGLDWRADPVYRAAAHPTSLARLPEPVTCAVVDSRVLPVGAETWRATRSELFEVSRHAPDGRGVRLPVRLVSFGRIVEGRETVLTRALLADDPLDGSDRFEPQVVADGGGVVARLSARHPLLLRIGDGRVEPLPAASWREAAMGAVPAGLAAGQTLDVDLAAMTGRIALQPAGAADPARPASAFRPGPVLVASLAWREGRLALVATRIAAAGEPGAEPVEAAARALAADREARAEAGALPDETEPCMLEAWSSDPDPKGLVVRAGPSVTARALGTVPPPRKAPPEQEAFGPEPLRAEFRVVGWRDGWFLVDRIQAPGEAYGISPPRGAPRPFAGRGFVSGRMVGAAYANAGLPTGRLYDAPQADASWREARDRHGNPLGPDGSPARILACSGAWALVDTDAGQRGWVRTLCANQATNCS